MIHKTILSIIPYSISNKEIFELKHQNKKFIEYFYESLPPFCIRKDNGRISFTENYHQFTGTVPEDCEEEYLFLDCFANDVILDHEISRSGIDEFFKDIDWRNILNRCFINDWGNNCIPETLHIVVKLEYTGEYEDVELKINVIGFLDNNLNLIGID